MAVFLGLCCILLYSAASTGAANTSSVDNTSQSLITHDQSLITLLVRQAIQLNQQETKLNQQASQLQKQDNKLQKLERKLTSMEKEHDVRTMTVAFSAYMSHEPHVQAAKGTTVPFGTLIVNAGGGYKTTTNAFTAPVAGQYFFIIHGDCSADFRGMRVTKNGNGIFDAQNDNRDSHVTGAGVMTLEKGDVVTTVFIANTGFVDSGKETTFSGFLVK